MKTQYLVTITFAAVLFAIGVLMLDRLDSKIFQPRPGFAAEDRDHPHPHDEPEQPSHMHGDEGHSHAGAEEKTAQVTLWSEDFEIFLEHRLLVVDHPAKFITHITHIDTWEPRKEGTVTFVLRHGGDRPIEQVVETPEREGIYIPTLTFPKEGDWSVSLVIRRNEQNRVVELPPFQVYASLDEAFHANDTEPPDGISFLKEQQWKVITATSPVVRKAMTEQLRLAGTISPCPEKKASVVPPIAGRLLVPQGGRLPRVGDRVEAGQTLALVQPPLAGPDLLSFLSNQTQIQSLQAEITAKAAEAEAEAARSGVTLASAQRLAERIRPLRESSAKSAREVEEAEFALQKAQTDVASAEKLRETYEKVLNQLSSRPSSIHVEDGFPTIDLKAPISGTVVEVNATSGENISADKAAFSLLDTGSVFLEAKIQESKLGQLSQDLHASFETPDAPGVLLPVLEEGGGRLVYLGTAVDPQSRTAPIIYEVPNPDGRIRVGMSVTVYLGTKHTENCLAVPESALVDADGKFAAYVQVSGETFQKRDLETGIRDNGYVQILSGLSEGERVVTKEAYAIRLASVSTSIPAHGHAH